MFRRNPILQRWLLGNFICQWLRNRLVMGFVLFFMLSPLAQSAVMFGNYSGGDVGPDFPLTSFSSPNPSGLPKSLEGFTLYMTFSDSTLSSTFGGSLTLNGASSPYANLNVFANMTGVFDGTSYRYEYTFDSSALSGMNPNTVWTLNLFDTASYATLESWSLGISAVPEPANVALGIFGVAFATFQGVRWWRRK